MARGLTSTPGTTRVAKNGYHYTKVEGRGWVLTHWLTLEAKLGREINSDKDMVRFKHGYTKRDYDDPNAMMLIKKNSASARKRRTMLQERIREYQAEIDQITQQIGDFDG